MMSELMMAYTLFLIVIGAIVFAFLTAPLWVGFSLCVAAIIIVFGFLIADTL